MTDETALKWLQDLAAAMADSAGLELPPFSPIQAGYTYIGQLISHDIVPPTTTSGHPRTVTPGLNLDSVYGLKNDAHLYFDEDGYFVLGLKNRDLRRDQFGAAQIPEPRNDENMIIAQMHVFWQRVHNALLANGYGKAGKSVQRLVIQLFQLIVIEDFLKQVLDHRVFNACFRNDENYTGFQPGVIAPEFSHAGFRFGHSMVREAYSLNDQTAPALNRLFQSGQAIQSEFFVNWRKFFTSNPIDAQFANRIDSFITPLMLDIPHQSNRNLSIDITFANLSAGQKAGLGPGLNYMMSVQQGLNDNNAPPESIGLVRLGGRRTCAFGVRFDRLPLWPYLLLEAEVHCLGKHLGVLGSLIVAETLRNAIIHSRRSVFKKGGYRFKKAIGGMGKLGIKLNEIIRSDSAKDPYERKICMHHVVQLLTEMENRK